MSNICDWRCHVYCLVLPVEGQKIFRPSLEATPQHLSLVTLQMFLDASTHLYKRLCPSVRRSVRPSVTTFFKQWIWLKGAVLSSRGEGEGRGRGGGWGGRIVVHPELVFLKNQVFVWLCHINEQYISPPISSHLTSHVGWNWYSVSPVFGLIMSPTLII